MTLSQNAVGLSFSLEVSVCPVHARQIVNHWTTREVWHFIFKEILVYFLILSMEKKKRKIKKQK